MFKHSEMVSQAARLQIISLRFSLHAHKVHLTNLYIIIISIAIITYLQQLWPLIYFLFTFSNYTSSAFH